MWLSRTKSGYKINENKKRRKETSAIKVIRKPNP